MNVVHIFEDKEGALLSDLIRKVYPSKEQVLFTGGNGNIANTMQELLHDPANIVIAYLDLVPDNTQLISTYNTIKAALDRVYYRTMKSRGVVLPIPCTEYCYLLSLPDRVFKDRESTFRKLSVKDSVSYEVGTYASYEKLCKSLCRSDLRTPARIGKSADNKLNRYCRERCPCSTTEFCKDSPSVVEDTLGAKAIRFVSEFPAFPPQLGTPYLSGFTLDKLWPIHSKLVSDYNNWAVRVHKCAHDDSRYCIKELSR